MSKLREEVAARYGRGAVRCGGLCISCIVIWVTVMATLTYLLIEEIWG